MATPTSEGAQKGASGARYEAGETVPGLAYPKQTQSYRATGFALAPELAGWLRERTRVGDAIILLLRGSSLHIRAMVVLPPCLPV